MIERTSKVSRGLILYHYRSKKRLYAEVKAAVVTSHGAALRTGGDPLSLGASVVPSTIERSLGELEREPRFLRMQLWDYLEGTDDMSELIVSFTEGFARVVSRVQEAGHMRKDIPDIIAPLIVRGALEYWLRNRRLVDRLAEARSIEVGRFRKDFLAALAACLAGPESSETAGEAARRKP